jgi:UrcA family protein
VTLVAAGAPALAQPITQTTTGELVVTGRYYVGPNVRALSAPVSYRDLDLTTGAGRDTLKQRVKTTAADLCKRLGEGGMGGTPAMTSCEQDAINSAAEQERVAFAEPAPSAYATNPPGAPVPAPAASSYGQPAATVTTQTVTNGPVPDTPENRARFGGPMSRAGRRTAPAGN